MKKREFLQHLSKRLSVLPEEEQARSIRYYNEMLEDYMEDVIPEEEAVARVGDVDAIADQILRDNASFEEAPPFEEKPKTANNRGLIIVLAILGFPIWFSILTSFLSIVFSIISGLFGIIISLFAVPIGLAGGAVGGILMSPVLFCTGNVLKGFLSLGGGLICAALAIVSIMASIWLIKRIWRLIRWIVRKVVGLFHRKKVA